MGKTMKRREFMKGAALVPASAALLTVDGFAETMKTGQSAQAGNAQAVQVAAQASSGASGTGVLPGYAGKILHSDMDDVGPDGKPTGQRATFTGHSKADAKPDAEP